MPKATTRARTRSRKVEARDSYCPYHNDREQLPTQAEEFCGAWINDGSNDGKGRECHKPLCRKHANIRLQLWLCPEHTPKEN